MTLENSEPDSMLERSGEKRFGHAYTALGKAVTVHDFLPTENSTMKFRDRQASSFMQMHNLFA
jgi:hypothetical protein